MHAPDVSWRSRSVPVIVVASARDGRADEVAERLRPTGAVVLAARSFAGCLRVATSVEPDVVLLDPALPPRLEKLLRAHPSSARARLLHLASDGQPGPRAPVGLPGAQVTASLAY
jgi:hypothetical protein